MNMSTPTKHKGLPFKTHKLVQNEKGAILLVSIVTLSLLTLAGLSTVEQTVVQERVAINGRAVGDASLNSEKGLKQAVADLVAGDIFGDGRCTGDAEEDPADWRCEKSGDGYTYVVTYVMSGDEPAKDENGDTIYKVSVSGVKAGASGDSLAADKLTAGIVLHDIDSSEDPDYESLSEQCQSTYNPVTRRVTFCHATGASGHKLQTTDINGWLNGHAPGHGPWSDFCALDCSDGDPGAPVVSEGEVPSYTLMFYTRGDVEFYAGGAVNCEETGDPANSKSDTSKGNSSKGDKSSKSESSDSKSASGGSSASVNCVALESSSSEGSKSESSKSESSKSESSKSESSKSESSKSESSKSESSKSESSKSETSKSESSKSESSNSNGKGKGKGN
jgi:hypothetical protein